MCNMTHSDGMSVCNLPPGARNLIVSIRALNNESITNDELDQTVLYYRLMVGNCFSCASGTGLN